MANLLSDAEEGAIIFSNDYNRISSVFMYFHYVEGMRPDVTLLEINLMNEPWYLRTIQNHEDDVYSEKLGNTE